MYFLIVRLPGSVPQAKRNRIQLRNLTKKSPFAKWKLCLPQFKLVIPVEWRLLPPVKERFYRIKFTRVLRNQ